MTDFDSMDPLIYRKNVTISNQSDLGIRTVKDDERFLNSPHFVGSFMYGEVCLIFFFKISKSKKFFFSFYLI